MEFIERKKNIALDFINSFTHLLPRWNDAYKKQFTDIDVKNFELVLLDILKSISIKRNRREYWYKLNFKLSGLTVNYDIIYSELYKDKDISKIVVDISYNMLNNGIIF